MNIARQLSTLSEPSDARYLTHSCLARPGASHRHRRRRRPPVGRGRPSMAVAVRSLGSSSITNRTGSVRLSCLLHGQAQQRAVASGREQYQRVVPPAPAVTDARVAVDALEPERCRPQMGPQRQARLARADDQDVQGMSLPCHTASFATLQCLAAVDSAGEAPSGPASGSAVPGLTGGAWAVPEVLPARMRWRCAPAQVPAGPP